MRVRLPWPPGVRDLPGRKEGHSVVRRSLWLATRLPQCAAQSTAAMKACLTLLSHLGRLHEPPVPKPRGTPKLSERYAGPGRLSGPGGGNGGLLGLVGRHRTHSIPPQAWAGFISGWGRSAVPTSLPSRLPGGPWPVGSSARWSHPPLQSPPLSSPLLPL